MQAFSAVGSSFEEVDLKDKEVGLDSSASFEAGIRNGAIWIFLTIW